MANEKVVSVVYRDALTGADVGRLIAADVINDHRDILTGDRYGIILVAEVATERKEILTGDRYGLSVFGDVYPGTHRDILTGDGFGKTWLAAGVQVIREVLMMEPPYKMAGAVREVLLSMENEPLTIGRAITGYRQAVVMLRPTMLKPSVVKSMEDVATLREQAVQQRSTTWPRSTDFAMTLRHQTVTRRAFPDMALMRSAIHLVGTITQVVQSRGKVYVPASGVYAVQAHQRIVQRRLTTPASQVRSNIDVRTIRQQWIASRARQVVVITTVAYVGQHFQQAVVENKRPAPRSSIDAFTLRELVVREHTMPPPGIDDRVGQQVQQVTITRVPTPPFGDMMARTLTAQVMQGIEVAPIWSVTETRATVQMTMIHRDTFAPAFAIGRHTATLAQQIVMKNPRPRPEGYRVVGSACIAFVLGRDVPAPWEVIDPGLGRHAFTLAQLSVLKRIVIDPGTINRESRYAYSIGEQVVVGDKFPLPDMPPPVIPEQVAYQVAEQVVAGDRDGWGPVSSVTARLVVESLAVGDNSGWIDATVPRSEIAGYSVAQALALGDATFPDAGMIQSAAEVAMLGQALAVGDTSLPDPRIPASQVQAISVTEFAALGDVQFPDPAIPQSEIRSSRVASLVAVHDPSLTGSFGMSEIQVPSVLEFLIIRDRSLVGIPLRQGPRPIVTVSMS